MFLLTLSVAGQSGSGNYTFLIASGFLCDSGDSSTCPGVVRSANGDTYEMSGTGTFDAQSKAVVATGTFTHKSPSGNTLETGVWIASERASFHSYGPAPGALMRFKAAFGLAPFGAKRPLIYSSPMPSGGLAILRIRLLPMRGPEGIAVLQANCALGGVPPERSVEGIRLTLERNGSEFSEEVSGRVLFLLMPPGIGSSLQRTPLDAAQTPPATPSN